ncbi:GroES-like protein [Trametes sanguinea]|nr:GroES-like protein [Trametes sanguinea]
MPTPTQQKALFLQAKQGEFAVASRPVPKPSPGEILVRNEASGLNPVDWKIQAYGIFVEKYPVVLGIDAAGVVEAVGEGVTRFKTGDKVFVAGLLGDLYEGLRTDGNDRATFQQYTLVPADLAAKLPDSLTFEQGAALPLALTTAAVGLYNQEGGPRFTPPWVEGGRGKYAGPVVVIGGSSVVGTLAIQLARLSGFSPIITTASLKNTTLLQGFGATHVLDRNLPSVALREEVVKIAGGPVSTVYDAISLPETQNAAFDLLAPGGKLILVLASAVDEEKQKNANGRSIVGALGLIQLPQNVEFGKILYTKLTSLLEAGDLKPLRVEVVPGGLGGIATGLEKLKHDQVSAAKLVVRPQETV